MARIDRYILSQFIMLFGFFNLIFILIFWVNKAVGLFDELILSGQSLLTFLEFSVLILPNLIRQITPLVTFVATLYVLNKIYADSELIILQTSGVSPLRLLRPALYFSGIVFVLMSLLVHVLSPLAAHKLKLKEIEISENIGAGFLKDRKFIEPIEGVTLYIQDIRPNGELSGVFLSDQRHRDRKVIYTAARAYVLQDSSYSQLILQDGLAQVQNPSSTGLTTSSFEQLTYNITTGFEQSTTTTTHHKTLTTFEILNPSLTRAQLGSAELRSLVHNRIMSSLLGPLAALIAASILISANFSRFGLKRYILLAVAAIIALHSLEILSSDIAQTHSSLTLAVYLPVPFALGLCAAFLLKASQLSLLRPRPKGVPAAEHSGASTFGGPK